MKGKKKMNATMTELQRKQILRNISNSSEILEAKQQKKLKDKEIKSSTTHKSRKKIINTYGGYEIDDDKVYNFDITSSKYFIKQFRKIVTDIFPQAKFPHQSKFVNETSAVTEILDILYKEDSRSEDVILNWMKWFANKKLNTERVEKYPISIRDLKSSWKEFSKVKISPQTTQTAKTSKDSKEKEFADIIGNRMKEIFNTGITNESIVKSCHIYGVVLTANFMKQFALTNENILQLIESNILKQDVSKIHSIYMSTGRYFVGNATKKDILLYDWLEKYKTIWNMIDKDPIETYTSQEKYVRNFFENLEI